MDTSDKPEKVEPKRGRPRKDAATPIGEYRIEEAKKLRENSGKNPVVESYYELCGVKLSLCKRKKTGTTVRTFIGSTNDKSRQDEISTFIKKLQAEGRLRIKV